LTASQFKLYASLTHKKYRQTHGLFIAEGSHLVSEALKSGWPVERVIIESGRIELAKTLKIPKSLLVVLSKAKFDRLAASQTPQGVLAIVKANNPNDEFGKLIGNSRRVVVADNIADPGNLGTMIRTAAAFNYDLFVCMGNCAEIYNPKTLRATQGAIFSISIIKINEAVEFLNLFKPSFKIMAFAADATITLGQMPKVERSAIVFGSEAEGITPAIEANADWLIRIEQTDRVESLNVAVAAGIGMYWGRI
jgi:TrmH family RNA methyltransferase